MESKKVSVIVPVYNAEKYIDGCVQSVLSQDYDDFELVLINDGSVDRSGIICEKYAGEYENVTYKYQENSGVSVARNTGIDVAIGEYVVFVDSDDRIKSNMLSLLVKELEATRADLCICGYDIVRTDRIVPMVIDQETVFGKDNLAEYFAKHFSEAIASSVCCKLYRRSLMLHRFRPGISMGEDLLFNLEYVKQINKVAAISDTLYIYDKTNDSSLTHVYKEIYHEQNLYVFKQWLDWFHEFDHVNDVNVHCRIVRSYLNRLFNVCAGTLPGKKIQMVRSMCDDDLDVSIKKAITHFDRLHRIVLRLIIHRKYRMLLFVGTAYCKVKKTRH